MLNVDYEKAAKILADACTPAGILASVTDTVNYRRIWARDSVISGLGGLLVDHQPSIEGLKRSVLTLAAAQGALGQIPSNVKVSPQGEVEGVSYGGLAGRVDPIPWFVIGACNYAHKTKDDSFLAQVSPAIERALKLLDAWEFNSRGLVYMPQGGDWADEFVYHGYVLLVQALRLWALRSYASLSGKSEWLKNAARVEEIIKNNYWPCQSRLENKNLYHAKAFRSYVEQHGDAQYYLVALTPGSYSGEFDFISNSLAVLLSLPSTEQLNSIVSFGNSVVQQLKSKIAPAFWPPVKEGDSRWEMLKMNYIDVFRNRPYEYHNGGLWPMVSGWWGAALCKAGEFEKAKNLFDAVCSFNEQDPHGGEQSGFHECGHAQTGEPAGTRRCTWSASAALMIAGSLKGTSLYFGDRS